MTSMVSHMWMDLRALGCGRLALAQLFHALAALAVRFALFFTLVAVAQAAALGIARFDAPVQMADKRQEDVYVSR